MDQISEDKDTKLVILRLNTADKTSVTTELTGTAYKNVNHHSKCGKNKFIVTKNKVAISHTIPTDNIIIREELSLDGFFKTGFCGSSSLTRSLTVTPYKDASCNKM